MVCRLNRLLSVSFFSNKSPKMERFNFFNLMIIALCLSSFVHSLEMGETCSSTSECDAGLSCQSCPANGNTGSTCTRIQPLNPTSKVNGLPFNKYSWLTTHNSYAITGANSATGSFLVSPKNQEDSITNQLKNGVRGIMLDTYDFQNDIWLCHSTGGTCFNFTAFVSLQFESFDFVVYE
jgi:hypothetical protein